MTKHKPAYSSKQADYTTDLFPQLALKTGWKTPNSSSVDCGERLKMTAHLVFAETMETLASFQQIYEPQVWNSSILLVLQETLT